MLPEHWVFGGVKENSKKCFAVLVPNRSKESLFKVIKSKILPETTIISECWKEYSGLEEHGYSHFTLNHSENFLDPVTKVNTQKDENFWFLSKIRNKNECGTNRYDLESYIFEFLWRRKYFNFDPFIIILMHISHVFCIEE